MARSDDGSRATSVDNTPSRGSRGVPPGSATTNTGMSALSDSRSGISSRRLMEDSAMPPAATVYYKPAKGYRAVLEDMTALLQVLRPPVVMEAMRQTWREILRSPCTYTLGVLSVLLVVLVAGVVQSLLSQAPLVFLRQAETSVGQIDMTLSAGSYSGMVFMNYTLFESMLANAPGASWRQYHAPRHVLSGIVHNPSTCRTDQYSVAGTTPTYGSASEGLDLDNAWMYKKGTQAAQYCALTCMDERCSPAGKQGATLYLLDTKREQNMGLGRQWTFDPIPPGYVIMDAGLARTLGLQQGDTFYLRSSIFRVIQWAFRPDGPTWGAGVSGPKGTSTTWSWIDRSWAHREIAIPLKLFDTFKNTYGKFGNKVTGPIIMEYEHFVSYLAPRLHPFIRNTPNVANSANAAGDLYQFAQEVVVNLPPEDRIGWYTNNNYNYVQDRIVEYCSTLLYIVGFTYVEVDTPIMDKLFSTQFVTLFLGLVLDILLFIMFGLSAILIYSLLMINVNTRTFELAVRRMLGTNRATVVLLLIVQALSFSLPAWVVGLTLAEGIARLLMASFAQLSGVPVSSGLTGSGVLAGTILALAVPLVSSIGPVHTALGKELRESLDAYRPATSALEYSIERAEDAGVPWSLVAIGSTMSIFGFAIYYLLPLSLLSLNLSLFFNIFFWILLGMLFGLVLLALNLGPLMERFVVAFTLFWDAFVVRQLSLANLIAHRVRNRKTTVMYSLSLAFIVFVATAANQELQSSEFALKVDLGTPLLVEYQNDGDGVPYDQNVVRAVENVLTNPDIAVHVDGFAWISQSLASGMNSQAGLYGDWSIANVGRLYSSQTRVRGISPNLADVVSQDFTDIAASSTDTGLSISEQLYTAAGSQGVLDSSFLKDFIGASLGGVSMLTNQRENTTAGSLRYVRQRIVSQALVSTLAGIEFSQYTTRNHDVLVSFPTYLRLSQGVMSSFQSIPLYRCHIQPTEDAMNNGGIDKIKVALQNALANNGDWDVIDERDESENISVTQLILNFFFTTLSAVAMFLCFFSLSASMITNIHEQKKEIGVLRAIGLTPVRLIRVYVYEAYTLVLSSAIMGICIGIIVGWTFAQQRGLFTQVPVVFYVPVDIIITVCVTSIVAALIAAGYPAYRLAHAVITQLLRSVS